MLVFSSPKKKNSLVSPWNSFFLVHVTCHGCIWPCELTIQMNQLFCMKNKLMQCIRWMTMTLMVMMMMMMTNKTPCNSQISTSTHFAWIIKILITLHYKTHAYSVRIFLQLQNGWQKKLHFWQSRTICHIHSPWCNLYWFFFSMKSFMCFGNGFLPFKFRHIIALISSLNFLSHTHTPQTKWNIFFFKSIVTH